MMEINECNYCVVDRIIEKTMIFSRLFGLAPVAFKKDQKTNRRVMHISRFFYIYGIVFNAVFCFACIYSIIMDIHLVVEGKTLQNYIIPISDKSICLVTVSVAILWSMNRMRVVMHTMEQIMRIKKLFQVDQLSMEKWYSLEFATVSCFIISVIDLWIKGRWENLLAYIHILSNLIVSLIALQFTDTVLIIQSGFKVLNKNLCDVLEYVEEKEEQIELKRIPVKSINKVIDLLGMACPTSYSEITWDFMFRISFHCMWTLLNIIIILSIVEPCYRNEQELENTRLLIGKVMNNVDSNFDPLLYETEIFFDCIQLNEVSYTALDICALGRPLLLTVIGSITTLLMLILQIN